MSCVMVEYNLREPGIGNQNLTLVVRIYLEVSRELCAIHDGKTSLTLLRVKFSSAV